MQHTMKGGFHQQEVERTGVTETRALDFGFCLENLTAGAAHAWMLVKPAHHLINRAIKNDSVRVEQKNVITRRGANALVVGDGEATVVAVDQENDFRKFSFDHFSRAIATCIVHDNNLVTQASLLID